MSQHAAHAWIIGVILALAACVGRPVPLSGHQGSTFMLFFPGELLDLPGYRSTVTEAGGTVKWSGGDTDPQRGELVFLLCPIGQHDCLELPDGPGYRLTNQYVTGITAHRASDAGIRNSALQYGTSGWAVNLRPQLIALIHIPAIVPPTTYELEVRIQRGALLENFLPTIDFGTFRVLQGEEAGNPIDADRYYQFVPNPQLELEWGSSENPAAAQIELSYPTDKIVVTSVYEADQLGQGSFVRLTHHSPCYDKDYGGFSPQLPGDPEFTGCVAFFCIELLESGYPNFDMTECEATYGYDSITIHLMDPDQLTGELAVTFHRLGQDVTTDPSAFSVLAQDSYDLDGIELSESWAVTVIR